MKRLLDVARGPASLLLGAVLSWSCTPAAAPAPPDEAAPVAAAYRACLAGDAGACHRVASLFARGAAPLPPRRRIARLLEGVCGTAYPVAIVPSPPPPRWPGEQAVPVPPPAASAAQACLAMALYSVACHAGRGDSCTAFADLLRSGRVGLSEPGWLRSLDRAACEGGDAPSCGRVAERAHGARWSLFERACAAGDARSCGQLARRYRRGLGLRPDLPRARALRTGACEGGDVESCVALADLQRLGLGGPREPEAAAEGYARACARHFWPACERHADAMQDPEEAAATRDRVKAAYRVACEARGDAEACARLAAIEPGEPAAPALARRACELGAARGCVLRLELDPEPELVAQLRRHCEAGHGEACHALGRRALGPTDEGTATAVDEAARWFAHGCAAGEGQSCNAQAALRFDEGAVALPLLHRGCALGDGTSCYHLARRLELPGTEQDVATAVEMLTAGCTGEHAPSCTRLGQMQARGWGLPYDRIAAERFLQQGCDAGDGVGCREVAAMLQGGAEGDTANRLGRRACAGGDGVACAELGERLLVGRGIALDGAMARTLLTRGCLGGAARACFALARGVDPAATERPLPASAEEAERFYRLAAATAGPACRRALAACHRAGPGARPSLRWEQDDLLIDVPDCGARTEDVCAIGVEAGEARCREGDAQACLQAAGDHDRLTEVGLSGDRDRSAALRKRACRLDPAHCPESVR